MIDLFKPKRASTILGLSFDGNRLEAVVVRRNNGSLQVLQSLAVPMALSPLSGDPQLVGREIRNHLDQAGIRERRCAVCLPLNWVLTVQTKLPDLLEADVASYLQIESERGFPSGHENLHITDSRASSGTDQYATLLGIPRNHIAILEQALKAAQLKPLTFSLGVTALAASVSDPRAGGLTLAITPHGIDLQVTAGGGIAALRSLDTATEGEGAPKLFDADLVARELRITLGQLPPAFAKEAETVKVFGRGDMARQFVSDITKRTAAMGLRVSAMERASDASFTQPPAAEIAMSPALALAANYLRATGFGPEFLPPKVQPWKQLVSGKLSSKKLAWIGAAAGAVVLMVVGAFVFQQWQINKLESQWKRMEPTYDRLVDDQKQIGRYRAYYDRSFPALRILRSVVQAFPEVGTVSAKTLEIRDLTAVTCSGSANNEQQRLALLDKLRSIDEVADLKTDSATGKSPVRFTLGFNWQEGGVPSGN